MKMLNASKIAAFFAIALGLSLSACEKDTSLTNPNDNVSPRAHGNNAAYLSSNTTGLMTVFDIFDEEIAQVSVPYSDADGIVIDVNSVFQLDRVNNKIHAYYQPDLDDGNTLSPSASSTSNFSNGREIDAAAGNIVVAQDDNGSNGGNKLVHYRYLRNNFRFKKSVTTNINLWGVKIIGNDVWAVVDNSNQLAVFYDFFSKPAGYLEPDAIVSIEGIVRTHGLFYDMESDVMFMTDVGAASSATDGAVHVIPNFLSKFSAGGTIALSDQMRIAGNNTFLGNPVDIDYGSEQDIIYVAERANGGGRLLTFDMPTMSGNPAPTYNATVAGASAIFLLE